MKIITTLFFMIWAQLMFAQEMTQITGTITDNENQPIPFASIYITELRMGGEADGEGKYTIRNIPYGSWQLTASAVGFKAATITINPAHPILEGVNFQLAHDNELPQVEVFVFLWDLVVSFDFVFF